MLRFIRGQRANRSAKNKMPESPTQKGPWSILRDHVAASISAALLGGAAILWSTQSDWIGRWLQQELSPQTLLAMLLGLLVILAYTSVSLLVYKKRARSFFERIEPVPGQGYFVDPVNDEFVCPVCASNDARSYLAHPSKGVLYCQSCKDGFKIFEPSDAVKNDDDTCIVVG